MYLYLCNNLQIYVSREIKMKNLTLTDTMRNGGEHKKRSVEYKYI